MDYNDVITPFYSETERTWATPQNWTVNGMNTLVLYVRGIATNDPGSLYVAIHDKNGRTGVAMHPDAAALTAVQWVEWKIPLTVFTDAGVTVTAVKKMYVGVGDRKTPKAGGAGALYVDDIRVIKSE